MCKLSFFLTLNVEPNIQTKKLGTCPDYGADLAQSSLKAWLGL